MVAAKLEANEKEQPELQENQLEQQQPPKQSELLEYLIASAKSTCHLTKPWKVVPMRLGVVWKIYLHVITGRTSKNSF